MNDIDIKLFDQLIDVAKRMYAPVLRSHRATVDQMAILEPVLSETVCATCLTIIREATDEAVRRGVAEEAARDFILGHLNVELAILFDQMPGVRMSDAANKAVDRAKSEIFQADWKKVFEAWKEVVNALIRGYTSNAFAAWTIPCMYVAGKYLRNFAIKADEQLRRQEGNVVLTDGFQDDIAGGLGKNDCLQDAARQVNRIFSVCITDRYATCSELPHNRSITSITRAPPFPRVHMLSLACVVGRPLRSPGNGDYTT